MRSFLRGLFVAGVALLATSTASAQRQPGGMGIGGFGVPQSVTAQVMTNAELQKDLKISDEQKDKFKSLTEKQAELRKKSQELFMGGGRPAAEKMAELNKERTALNEEVTKTLDSTLSNDQKRRIKQIEVQRLGLRAFSDVKVVLELKIDLEQYNKIEEVLTPANRELAQIGGFGGFGGFGGGGGGRPGGMGNAEENAKKRAEITEKAMEKISALLSDEQRKAWSGMVGEKFDLTKLNTGFGMGGRNP